MTRRGRPREGRRPPPPRDAAGAGRRTRTHPRAGRGRSAERSLWFGVERKKGRKERVREREREKTGGSRREREKRACVVAVLNRLASDATAFCAFFVTLKGPSGAASTRDQSGDGNRARKGAQSNETRLRKGQPRTDDQFLPEGKVAEAARRGSRSEIERPPPPRRVSRSRKSLSYHLEQRNDIALSPSPLVEWLAKPQRRRRGAQYLFPVFSTADVATSKKFLAAPACRGGRGGGGAKIETNSLPSGQTSSPTAPTPRR